MPDADVPPVVDEVSMAGPRLTASGADLWKSVTATVRRPARTVPLLAETEVLVAGGGVTGIIAALAAARSGARTFLVESFSMLGGNMGPGVFAGGSLHLALHNPEAFPRGLGGIPAEFNRRVVSGAARASSRSGVASGNQGGET